MSVARPFLIGPQWRSTTLTAPIMDPFTREKITDVCQAGKEAAEEAVSSAVQAFPLMRHLSAYARSNALVRIAESIAGRHDELARTMTAEAGKPISDARREVSRAIQTFTVAAEEAKRIPGEVVPLDLTPGTEHYLGITQRFPIGPVLGITPFNFPLNLVAHKVAPCLAVGNPIVLKPAPQTPLTALLLGEIVLEAGLPAGALNVVPCDNTVAEGLVTDARFKMLSFTGSAAVGWMLKAKCGNKRVALELGGNAGVIVEPDADLDRAVQRCVAGGFVYAGQTCISVQRVYVHETVYASFLEKLLPRAAKVKVGDPKDEATVIGPLIDEGAARRIEEWLEEAVANGACVRVGGKRAGSLFEATVVTDVSPDMKISCREVFGPVITVAPYRRFEEALTALNDSAYGLQAGVFTRDINKLFHAYRTLEVGAVLANEIPTFRADHMPYGGVKDSGLGREGVRYAIEEMTELKLLVLNLGSPE
ncbi:MAG TPA: aldehyde dehydrogenase family protein [Nitrospiraceae bacterium]|nr:aldehyde dehydrogenase family protein [Nitrospiraceae bacterium]